MVECEEFDDLLAVLEEGQSINHPNIDPKYSQTTQKRTSIMEEWEGNIGLSQMSIVHSPVNVRGKNS